MFDVVQGEGFVLLEVFFEFFGELFPEVRLVEDFLLFKVVLHGLGDGEVADFGDFSFGEVAEFFTADQDAGFVGAAVVGLLVERAGEFALGAVGDPALRSGCVPPICLWITGIRRTGSSPPPRWSEGCRC